MHWLSFRIVSAATVDSGRGSNYYESAQTRLNYKGAEQQEEEVVKALAKEEEEEETRPLSYRNRSI